MVSIPARATGGCAILGKCINLVESSFLHALANKRTLIMTVTHAEIVLFIVDRFKTIY